MIALRIMILCVAAALICSALRTAQPQIASAVALAAGVAALMLSLEDLGVFAQAIQSLERIALQGNQIQMLKICGVALVAEFASDICRDSGESALARRIDAGVKIGITATALPVAMQIIEKLTGFLE